MDPSLLNAPEADEMEPKKDVVPVWLIVLMVMLLYWGAVYFDRQGGWFSPQVYAPYRNLEEVRAYQPGGGAGDLFELGRSVYGQTCVACHQANGLGVAGQFPPLADSEWVNEPEPGRLIRIVLAGLQGPMTVKGQQYGAATMTPFAPILSDQQIAAVLTYVRQNADWGNKAPAVTPEQVAAVREKIANRSQPFTAPELLSISPAE